LAGPHGRSRIALLLILDPQWESSDWEIVPPAALPDWAGDLRSTRILRLGLRGADAMPAWRVKKIESVIERLSVIPGILP
jgi:hypothetical protein